MLGSCTNCILSYVVRSHDLVKGEHLFILRETIVLAGRRKLCNVKISFIGISQIR